MQRTAEAIVYIHERRGFYSKAYLDDFGGAEPDEAMAQDALAQLQRIMADLGVVEAVHKIHEPAQIMIWLGIEYNTREMTMTIPDAKMAEIMTVLGEWQGRVRASRTEMQSLIGLLQFVASVSPPVRVFSNRMLQCLRDTPNRGTHGLSMGFKKDLKFFADLLPDYNGIRVIDKEDVPYQSHIELDACLTGCGATIGTQYYAEIFPPEIQKVGHSIAHLELLNVVVAIKMWGAAWRGMRVRVVSDNSNACLAMQTGRSRDDFMQHCVRELFMWQAKCDVELVAVHRPGVLLIRADALSRMHSSHVHAEWVRNDPELSRAVRVRVPAECFALTSDL